MDSEGSADDEGTQRVLFVASSGGHVSELLRLLPHFRPSADSWWVTFDTPQTRSLLQGRRVEYIGYVRPRDPIGVLRTVPRFWSILRRERFDLVVSTGAGIALAGLPIARFRRMRALYVESVARVSSPSLTGRMLAAVRGSELATQHPGWAKGRWTVHPGVLGSYRRIDKPPPPPERPRLLVTLGTIEGYSFDAAVDAVLASGLADDSTVWQLGSTPARDLPGVVHKTVGLDVMEQLVADSDVVICHAGVGTLLMLFDAGVYPVVLVRRQSRREHADDHQAQIGALIAARGLGEVVEAPDLDAETIRRALAYAVEPVADDGA